MNKALSTAIGFVIGAGIGFVAGKFIFEKKANDKIQAEIDAIQADYHSKSAELAKKNEVKPEPEDLYAKSIAKLDKLKEYAEISREHGYISEEAAEDAYCGGQRPLMRS